jgi:hypothetical protein
MTAPDATGYDFVVDCFRLSDGERLWTRRVFENAVSGGLIPAINVLEDNSVQFICSAGFEPFRSDVLRYELFSSDGHTLIQIDTELHDWNSINWSPSGLLLRRIDSNNYTVFTRENEPLYAYNARTLLSMDSPVSAMLEDGGLMLAGAAANSFNNRAARLDGNGRVLWETVLQGYEHAARYIRTPGDFAYVWQLESIVDFHPSP